MFEPVKYALPVAFCYYAALYMQLAFDWQQYTLERWLVMSAVSVVAVVVLYSWRIKGNYSFKLLWFSGFSVVMLAHLCYGLLILILGELMPISMEQEQSSFNIYTQIAFTEFISQSVYSLIWLTAVSWVIPALMNKK